MAKQLWTVGRNIRLVALLTKVQHHFSLTNAFQPVFWVKPIARLILKRKIFRKPYDFLPIPIANIIGEWTRHMHASVAIDNIYGATMYNFHTWTDILSRDFMHISHFVQPMENPFV